MHDVARRQAASIFIALLWLAGMALSPVKGDEPTLAIKGYDPVAYFTESKAVPGRPEFRYEWDEHVYQFRSAEHRDLFKANPVRYAPQFANFCAMSLVRAELVEADPEHWLIRDGKLYLFGKPIGPDLFQKDYPDNLEKANRNRGLVEER